MLQVQNLTLPYIVFMCLTNHEKYFRSKFNEEFEDTKRGNQNPYIEEQTTQWPKEKVQKDKQRSTKHTHTSVY
jgi:hypothetical protein